MATSSSALSPVSSGLEALSQSECSPALLDEEALNPAIKESDERARAIEIETERERQNLKRDHLGARCI